MSIIEVKHLTKEYDLGAVTSIKDNLRHTLAKIQGKNTWQRERFKALDDINFTIEQGEVIGIIGHNGAGKSTLLKHLANITKPTTGEVIVRGSIAPLIEVGAGVNPELTGRENIFLNGAILGIPKKIIRSKLDEIIDFSELEQFIDTPVKRYSSGMTVKLGFSIATSMDADILIIDEVLAVGDIAFQRKCFDRMSELITHQGKTVILVSHNIRQIERICNRVLLLDKGKILKDDKPKESCNKYYELSDKQIQKTNKKKAIKTSNKYINVLDIKLLNSNMEAVNSIVLEGSAYLSITIEVLSKVENPIFGVGVHTTDLLYLASKDTEIELPIEKLEQGKYTINVYFNKFPFLPSTYAFRVGIAIGSPTSTIFYEENLCSFQVNCPSSSSRSKLEESGFIQLDTQWQINKH